MLQKKLILSLLFIFPVVLQGQSLGKGYSGTIDFDGRLFEYANSIATDTQGNIILVGQFTGEMDFDPGPGTFYGYSEGLYDIFIMKLSPSMGLIWAHTIGGPKDEYAYTVDTDNHGNVYVSGGFVDTLDFDPGPGNHTLIPDVANYYVLKLSSSGNFLWANFTHNSDHIKATSLHIDNSSNVLITGYFKGITDFDPGTGTQVDSNQNNSSDIFIQKLDSLGNYVWSGVLNGDGNNVSYEVISDKKNNVIFTGYYTGSTIDFDPGPSTYVLNANNIQNTFTLKLDSNGVFQWVREVTGNGPKRGLSLHVDSLGSIYTTGDFWLSADFDPGPSQYILSAPTNAFPDIYVRKLDENGNFLWAKRIGGDFNDFPANITGNASGQLFITGGFENTVDFDPGPDTFYLQAYKQNGLEDMFILNLDSSGSYGGAVAIGSERVNYGKLITMDANENLYFAGDYVDTIDFNPFSGKDILKPQIQNGHSRNVFLSKYIPCQQPIPVNDTALLCGQYTVPSGDETYYQPGIYSDTILNSVGCDSILTIVLDSVTIDTGIQQSGGVLTSNTNGASYQWLDCNPTYSPITGAIQQSFHPTTNGSYAVIITKNGCTDTSSCKTVTNAGMPEKHKRKGIVVFPNPSPGNVEMHFPNDHDYHEITLYNNQGKMEDEFKIRTQNRISFALPKPKGLYLIQVKGEKGNVTNFRIIKN